jgi:hypothetical protein
MAQIILDSNNNLIQGDFDNATLNNRTKLQTTTTNATTNVYVVPNGSSTSAGVSVANNSSLTNASKIVMATNGSTDTQIISGVNGSGTYLPLSFYTNNALAMQITTGGIISAAGGGIQFPATQIPSADANTLDDYEEGSWTPGVAGDTTAGSYTYSTQSGTYTKIGRLVTAHFTLAGITTSSAGSGSIKITGLPFTSAGSGAYGDRGYNFVPRIRSFTTTRSNIFMLISVGTTSIYVLYDNNASGNGSDIQVTEISSGNSQIGGTVIYVAA